MSDDWQKGDLALCVKIGGWRGMTSGKSLDGPRPGCFYTLSWAGMSRGGQLSLEFADFDTPRNPSGTPIPWLADRFRKIRPHEADEQDAETIALLNGRPVPVPA